MGVDPSLKLTVGENNLKATKGREAPQYFPLVNKQIVIVSQTPLMINYNICLQKDH